MIHGPLNVKLEWPYLYLKLIRDSTKPYLFKRYVVAVYASKLYAHITCSKRKTIWNKYIDLVS